MHLQLKKNTSWHKVLNLLVRSPIGRRGGIGYFSQQCGMKLRWKRSLLIVLKSVLFSVTTVPHPHFLPLLPNFIISSYFIPRSSPPSPSSSSISSSSGPPSPTRTDGLSQLTALLQKGEKKGIFKDKMPASIQRVVSSEFSVFPIISQNFEALLLYGIDKKSVHLTQRGISERCSELIFLCIQVHTENLQFMQNRDVYNVDYFRFILNLASCNAVSRTLKEIS